VLHVKKIQKKTFLGRERKKASLVRLKKYWENISAFLCLFAVAAAAVVVVVGCCCCWLA
jgi:hypothetical protein